MTHPLTPRAKVAQIISGAPFPSKRSYDKADAILTDLASGSGDHAELINLLRWGQKDPLGDGGTYIIRNPDGRRAADVLEALLAENAALRSEASDLREHRITADLLVSTLKADKEEAERKLAEAVGLLTGLCIGTSTAKVRAVREWLSKEAERE